MYSPVAAPRQRRSSTSPQPKSSFQKELEAKIKSRRAKGLATDITPRDSEDELASDDDLMAGFNMTSKSPSIDKGKSGSSALDAIFGRKTVEEKPENLNKTWKPPGYNAPIPARRKSSALADSDDEDLSDKEEKRWQPPGNKRSDSRGSDTIKNGHTSPRTSRSASRNSNPASRSQTPKSQLERGQDESYEENMRQKSSYTDLLNRKSPKPKKGLLSDSEDSDSDEIKKTLQKDRKSPFQQKSDKRMSPKDSGDRRNSFARNSPSNFRDSLDGDGHHPGSKGDRKSPFEQRKGERKSPLGNDKAERNMSSKRGSRQYSNDDNNFEDRLKGERSPLSESRHQKTEESRARRHSRQNSADRKSPYDAEKYSRQGSKDGDRKSPHDAEQRKSPFDQKHRKSPFSSGNRKGKLSDSDEDSDEDSNERNRERAPKRSSSRGGRSSVTFEDEHQLRQTPQNRRGTPSEGHLRPTLKNRTTEDGDRPTLQRQRTEYDEHSRKKKSQEDDLSNSAFRPVPKPRRQSETSSLCDETEKEPGREKRGTPQPSERATKSGKGKKTEKQLLDHVIDSIDGAQEDNRMKFIQEDANKDKKKDTLRPKSGKLHKPKPRYASGSTTPNLNDSLNGSFNSTSDIRSAVYNSWLLEREERKKQEMKEKLKREKEEEEKKRKEEEFKRLEAMASYKAWLESKKDFGKDNKIAQKNEEKKKKKEVHEQIEKKTEAELVFRKWKEEKDKRIKEAERKKKRKEEEELKKKQEEKMEKVKDSQSAFKGWKSKKDKEILNTHKNKKTQEENNKQDEEYAKTLREEESVESYEKWMARKEKQKERERRERLKKKHLEEEDEDYVPPWSPAGRTIPAGR